jgi:hypothetical protein
MVNNYVTTYRCMHAYVWWYTHTHKRHCFWRYVSKVVCFDRCLLSAFIFIKVLYCMTAGSASSFPNMGTGLSVSSLASHITSPLTSIVYLTMLTFDCVVMINFNSKGKAFFTCETCVCIYRSTAITGNACFLETFGCDLPNALAVIQSTVSSDAFCM